MVGSPLLTHHERVEDDDVFVFEELGTWLGEAKIRCMIRSINHALEGADCGRRF